MRESVRDAMAAIIAAGSSSLRRVSINQASPAIWRAIGQCTQLSVLALHNQACRADDAHILEAVRDKPLESLTIDCCFRPISAALAVEMVQQRDTSVPLRHLACNDWQVVSHVWAKCPELFAGLHTLALHYFGETELGRMAYTAPALRSLRVDDMVRPATLAAFVVGWFDAHGAQPGRTFNFATGLLYCTADRCDHVDMVNCLRTTVRDIMLTLPDLVVKHIRGFGREETAAERLFDHNVDARRVILKMEYPRGPSTMFVGICFKARNRFNHRLFDV